MAQSFGDVVGQVDVAFVIDTTGSMGPFIEAARRHVRTLAEEVARAGALDLQFAVVEYRDHPPQEQSFVTRPHPFGDGDALQSALETLVPQGGGDAPEAVLDGLIAAARLQWRPYADRLCYLIGDAPPHGAGEPHDAWAEGCPCRATPAGVVELLAGNTIRLNAITLTANAVLVRAFAELATGTGGALTEAPEDADAAAMATAAPIATASRFIGASRDYLAAAADLGTHEPTAVAEAMGWSEDTAKGVAAYLRRRGLFGKRGH